MGRHLESVATSRSARQPKARPGKRQAISRHRFRTKRRRGDVPNDRHPPNSRAAPAPSAPLPLRPAIGAEEWKIEMVLDLDVDAQLLGTGNHRFPVAGKGDKLRVAAADDFTLQQLPFGSVVEQFTVHVLPVKGIATDMAQLIET